MKKILSNKNQTFTFTFIHVVTSSITTFNVTFARPNAVGSWTRPHLGLSPSGRSRGWSQRCPCVSSRPPLGCSGLQQHFLLSAAPADAVGASARAPETPAGTGFSCPPLQVSEDDKDARNS